MKRTGCQVLLTFRTLNQTWHLREQTTWECRHMIESKQNKEELPTWLVLRQIIPNMARWTDVGMTLTRRSVRSWITQTKTTLILESSPSRRDIKERTRKHRTPIEMTQCHAWSTTKKGRDTRLGEWFISSRAEDARDQIWFLQAAIFILLWLHVSIMKKTKNSGALSANNKRICALIWITVSMTRCKVNRR